jgi:putative DNA primase/helicase
MSDLARAWEQGSGDELIVPPPSNPMAVARMFLSTHYTDNGRILIRHHRNTFWSYNGSCWPELDERRLSSDLYRWLESAKFWKKNGDGKERLEDFAPSRYKLADLIDAIKGHVHLDMHITPPAWLEGEARGVVPMANGLLDIATRELLPHTPDYFSPHVLPFDYDENAPYPSRWHRFLYELWGDDEGSQRTLAEIVGIILGGDTSLQKIFMLVGPKRSGKGTIGRVLTGLLGAHNVAAPTLSGLTTNFGLSPLIGRPLGLISDARLGSRADGSVAVERLLSVSGEDSITIDRKYRDPWTGRLPTRFIVLTNEIPRFTDSSGALASRFVILVLSSSFYGKENPRLTDELIGESSGIFNWALEGLDRLLARGYFEQPATARAALRRLEDLSSPVGAFVRDRCVIDPVRHVDKDVLWEAWKEYCHAEGRDRAGTKNVFYRDLHAAYPGLVESRPRVETKRVRVITGIDLHSPADPDTDDSEERLDETRTNPDQDDPIPVLVHAGGQQNRWSEALVQDGPGSPPPLSPLGSDRSNRQITDHESIREQEEEEERLAALKAALGAVESETVNFIGKRRRDGLDFSRITAELNRGAFPPPPWRARWELRDTVEVYGWRR